LSSAFENGEESGVIDGVFFPIYKLKFKKLFFGDRGGKMKSSIYLFIDLCLRKNEIKE
jgi:hypothetical protein